MEQYYRARSWPFCDGNICHGDRECGYGPGGCDDVWELYQWAVAGAFQEANPQLPAPSPPIDAREGGCRQIVLEEEWPLSLTATPHGSTSTACQPSSTRYS